MSDVIQRYVRRIRELYPEIVMASTRQVDHGQNNDVVVVNDDLLFRFPRYPSGIALLERETQLLRNLQGSVPVAIPDPLYTSFAPREVGQVFMGYRLIPGAPLEQEMLQDRATLRKLATRLASFLRHLHRVPITAALPGASPVPIVAKWQGLYEQIRNQLFPYMRPDARAWTVGHFEAFLQDPRTQALTPMLIHGDFGASNILYDPTQQTLTGIIDFSSAGPDDPAVDFAAASTIAPDFLSYFYTAYPEVRDALHRVAFYKGTFALQEALFGRENGDDDAFRAGMEEYV